MNNILQKLKHSPFHLVAKTLRAVILKNEISISLELKAGEVLQIMDEIRNQVNVTYDEYE